MTIASEHRHTMKMLAKVARGLDLPPPAVAGPPQAPAPLADDETLLNQRLDETVAAATTAAGTASDPAGAPLTDIPAGNQHSLETLGADRGTGSASGRPAAVSDPAAPSDTSATEIDPAQRPTPRNSATVAAPSVSVPTDIPTAKNRPQLSLPEDRSEETFGAPTAAPDPVKHPESSTYPAPPISSQPGSPATVAGASRSTRDERTETQSVPDRRPAGENSPAMAENPAKPAARWQLFRAAKPANKSSRPDAPMLRPIFDNPDQADAAPPPGIRPREDSMARDRSPAAQRQPDRAATAGALATRPLQKQPAPGADKRAPSGNQKALLHLSSPRPPAEQPRPTQPQPAAASKRRQPHRPPNRLGAPVGQTAPGKPTAITGPGQAATSAATQDRPGAKTDGVSIGRINIQVRGPRQTEDDWPEPPHYTSHSITTDWEWSCHYGK